MALAQKRNTNKKEMHLTNTQDQSNDAHQPVLLDEVLHWLAPQTGETFLDATAGYGGHAAAVLERTENPSGATLVDRDGQAIAALEPFAKQGARLIHSDFNTASQQLAEHGQQFDLILADLGVSSPHLNITSRGFGFSQSGPLDMRMDQRQTLTAHAVVNTYSEAELADILWRFGEEPKARQIARQIVRHRPFSNTAELARVVSKAWPGRSKVHPATRSFQAIRIVVNDELNQLEQAVPLWVSMLKPGGRLAVISFHSLEDRIVKRSLAEYAEGYEAQLKLLTKGPETATEHEKVINPRARSAKLRAAAKINT